MVLNPNVRQQVSRTSSCKHACNFKFSQVLQDRTTVCWLDEAGGWCVKGQKDFICIYPVKWWIIYLYTSS